MKRKRRMVTLGSLADDFIKNTDNLEFQKSLLRGLPTKLYGKAIAAQVTEIRVEDGFLILRIPDDSWRKELGERKQLLLHKAREIYGPLKGVYLRV